MHNACAGRRYTPLIYATLTGNPAMARALLDAAGRRRARKHVGAAQPMGDSHPPGRCRGGRSTGGGGGEGATAVSPGRHHAAAANADAGGGRRLCLLNAGRARATVAVRRRRACGGGADWKVCRTTLAYGQLVKAPVNWSVMVGRLTVERWGRGLLYARIGPLYTWPHATAQWT
jgi:hypothetical protein